MGRRGNAYIEYLVAAAAILLSVMAFVSAGKIKAVGNQYQGLVAQAGGSGGGGGGGGDHRGNR